MPNLRTIFTNGTIDLHLEFTSLLCTFEIFKMCKNIFRRRFFVEWLESLCLFFLSHEALDLELLFEVHDCIMGMV